MEIQEEVTTVTRYVAPDGVKFFKKSECEKYEEYLNFKTNCDFYDTNGFAMNFLLSAKSSEWEDALVDYVNRASYVNIKNEEGLRSVQNLNQFSPYYLRLDSLNGVGKWYKDESQKTWFPWEPQMIIYKRFDEV